MSSSVRFSVVIPLYNKANYIESAIASVCNQTWAATEIIIVDDGSTDGGADIVRGLNIPALRLIVQLNSGVSAARNQGIEAATQPYIAFLDADDAYEPDFLAAIARLIGKFPHAKMFCTGYNLVDLLGQRTEVLHPSIPQHQECLVSDFYTAWCKRSFTSSSAIVVRRDDLVAQNPPFPVGERLGEDQDLWFRLAEAGEVAYACAALSNYHVGLAGSATTVNIPLDILPCYQRLGDRLETGKVPVAMRRGAFKLLASHVLNTARACGRGGQFGKAASLLCERRAFRNPVYWLRTALWLTAKSLKSVVSR